MIEQSRRTYLIHRIHTNSIACDNGCIEWASTRTKGGYGLIHFAKELGEGWNASTTAHRAMYMATHNIILTRSQLVCHTCDNPPCVNPAHLFVGTGVDNARDMIAKGRQAKAHAKHSRVLVLTNEQVIAIRNDMGLLREVAARHGVSVSYVSKLRNGRAKTLV